MRPGVLLTIGTVCLALVCAPSAPAQSDRAVREGASGSPSPPVRDQAQSDRRRAGSDEINIVLRRRGDGPFEMFVNGELISGPARERYWRALLGPELLQGMRAQRSDRMDGQTDAAARGQPRRDVQDRAPGRDGQESDAQMGTAGLRRPPWMGADWPRRDAEAELTDERVAEMLEVIGDFDAALHRRLTAAMERNPERVREQLRKESRVWAMALEMRTRDPERYALNVEERRLGRTVGELVRRYQQARETNDEQRLAEVRQEMRRVVTAQYDVREKIRQRDLRALEERLERLREQVAQRQAKREEIIDQYVGAILERGVQETDERRRRSGP